MGGRYRAIDPKEPMPDLEERVLGFWRDEDVIHRSFVWRRGAQEWVFYDGPPTANNPPHIGHVEARTFKDLYPRFRTMAGFYVHRKAGWDCHGLPVEVEVEKMIGTRSKRDIEAFGVARFIDLCRRSVERYVADWRRVSERMGHWIDMDDPYWTMTPEYVQSVWWAIKRLHELGLLFEDDKSSAYCPRCGTGLSDAEVALGYTTVTDPSVYVRFPVRDGPQAVRGASFLAWTTTPWRLPSNVALAVHPELPYAVVRSGDERLLVAEAVVERLFGEDAEVVTRVRGADLEGTTYEPPFQLFALDGPGHVVLTADFVAIDEGTGVVHIAPAFGQEDLDLGKRHGLARVNPMDEEGRFDARAGRYAGMPVKEADPLLVEELGASGKLWRSEEYEHTYPLCWRCETPLLYWARKGWYVRTSVRQQELLAANERVNWYPGHIKDGRYGDWLANNVDWSLSRDRYWGTPLPIWRCPNGHVTVVGSLAELSPLAGRDLSSLDPHRPGIDGVTIACPECAESAARVPQVADAWFDSGAMPFAQWGYPHRGKEEFARRYPADFIAEGIDQTRGWFYSLMAEGVLLFGENAYRNVICHGLVLDAEGRKMSKRLGNVIEPEDAFARFGADAVRWVMVTSGSPWSDRRVSFDTIGDVVRRFLLTVRNTHAFFVTYANVDDVDGATLAVAVAERLPLDRWILSQLQETVARTRGGLEAYDATGACRRLERFVDDLSNWYVRRSRRRFWDPAGETAARDKEAAYATLYTCLTTLSRLLAPIVPFVAEDLYRGLVAEVDPQAPPSVHLTDYPAPEEALRDPDLDDAMVIARQVASLGRAARTDAKIRVRQPLARALVHVPGDPARLAPLVPLVADELNVREVRFAEQAAGELGRWRARPSFRALGPRLGPRVKDLAAALAADDGTLAARLAAGEQVTVELGGEAVDLAPEDADLTRETPEGWDVASDGQVTVALDLVLTDDLRAEGLARELVRAVQDARREAGLEVTDRIRFVVGTSDPEVRAAFAAHEAFVRGEVLAVSLQVTEEPPPGEAVVDIDGAAVGIALERA
ncbi:MAG TPA: isoleucine--tRNA ligase [Actinomycetota bacterium]|nr:isoleucine--tRNA ligase [Actinomycetota bacterium]